MPRVKSDQERGYIGAWMRRERLRPDRDWSPETVVEMLASRGQRIREDYYRQLESGAGGKRPGPELMVALVDLFGSEPQAPHEQAGSGGDDPRIAGLLAIVERQQQSIDALTQAVTQLVARLDGAALVVPPSADTGGPLPPQGLARGVRDLLRLELAEEQAEDPEGVPGEASPRDTGR